ncbi:cupin domain-containing protein [Nemania diffusa]|nr:cupin domain-containing protein [Nemania diffusa]
MSTSGPLKQFPAPGLRTPTRYITGHNTSGDADFLQQDLGDHLATMLGGAAAQSIMYSSKSNPVQITNNQDLEFAKNNRPAVHVPNGVCVRMIDFAPGTESILHRALTLGIGTVCEGEIELTLSDDRSQNRVLGPGDVCINRCAMHRWRNVSSDKPARMLFVMLDVEPVIVNGKALEFEMGSLMSEYAEYDEGAGPGKNA